MKILLTTLNAKYVHSNLALRYLFAVAKENLGSADADNQDCISVDDNQNLISAYGHQVEMREFTINNDMSYIYNEIIRGDYDMVCFSCYIWNIEKTKEVASWVKKANSETLIVFGGPEVSFETESFLRENSWCDYVVRGEGEAPFGYIFDKIPQSSAEIRHTRDDGHTRGSLSIKDILKDCHGISYLLPAARQGSDPTEYIEIPQSAPLCMDKVPFPYEAGKIEPDKVVYYESSRGCPYRCSYCLSSIEKTIRARSLELTLEELDFFLKERVKQVKFIDRTFNFDKKRAFQIWEHLIKNDNRITNFHFEICAELMNEEIFQLLQTARHGLFQFEIGIQSTNQIALEAVNRHNDLSKITENVKRLVSMGNSHVHVDLIAGLPYEDFTSFTKSFDEVYSLGADNLQLGFLKLLKGTSIRSGVSSGDSSVVSSGDSSVVSSDDSKAVTSGAPSNAFDEPHGYVYRDKAPYEIIKNNYISAQELMKLKMVETVLELYANKEGFANSISLLIDKKGQGPFAFFMDIAEFFFAGGYQNRSHKKEDLYRILYKYVSSREAEEDKDIAQNQISHEELRHPAFNNDFCQTAKATIYGDLEASMNFDAVKKFNKKGWDI